MSCKLDQVRIMRHKLPTEIVAALEDMARNVANATCEEANILGFLERHAMKCELRGEKLFFAALIAIVLADIGWERSPFWRKEDIQKIQMICKQKGINYELMRVVASHEAELVDLVRFDG